jgi:Ran GTPase-activating protein (RanGAP) involved in mRNA processing and transport
MINRERLEILALGMEKGNVLKTLESLDLSKNCFRAAGAKIISEVILKENTTLKHLNLFSNLIEVEGCTFICKALETNCTLEFLDIGKNKIRNKGVTLLFSSICNNQSSALTSLGIRNNHFDDKGIHNLIQILKLQGTSLKSIFMKKNKINKYNHNNFDSFIQNKGIYIDILESHWLNDPDLLKSCVMVEGITKDQNLMYKLRTISQKHNLNEFKSIRVRECNKKKGTFFAVLEVID